MAREYVYTILIEFRNKAWYQFNDEVVTKISSFGQSSKNGTSAESSKGAAKYGTTVPSTTAVTNGVVGLRRRMGSRGNQLKQRRHQQRSTVI